MTGCAGTSRFLATRMAWRTTSSTPSPVAAQMGTTGTPSIHSMRLMSTEPPLPVSSSIMLRATTVGMPMSRHCIVR